MTNYCVLADCADPAVNVKQKHVDSGNVYVDVMLCEYGINPSNVVLPKPLLTEIAAVYAKREACISGAIGDNSTLIDKAKQFERSIELLKAGVTKLSLGIAEEEGGGYGSVVLGRA